MRESDNEWIDPAAARRLMLEYRQTLGVKGGSEIERQIERHTRLGISRKTIENWLNDPNSVPSPQTLKIVLRFLRTAHFQEVVPRTRDYLDADARLCRIGTALFDLYGAQGEDASVLLEDNARIAGWWIAPVFMRGNSKEPSYLYIAPVTDCPFSKIHMLLRTDDVPRGSGIVFPRAKGRRYDFSVRIWSKEKHYREKILTLSYSQGDGTEALPKCLHVAFESSEQPEPFPGMVTIWVAFDRIDERAIPHEIQGMFDAWSRDLLPREVGQGTVIS